MSDEERKEISLSQLEARLITLGLTMVVPVVTGHGSDAFFKWLKEVDDEPVAEGFKGEKPLISRYVIPMLRSLLSGENGEFLEDEALTARYKELSAAIRKAHGELKSLFERFELAEGARRAEASPSERPN